MGQPLGRDLLHVVEKWIGSEFFIFPWNLLGLALIIYNGKGMLSTYLGITVETIIRYYIKFGEVTGFRLFRATGLAFLFVRRTVLLGKGVGAAFTAIAPKYCWNIFSVLVRVRGRATGLVFASCPKDCFARQGRRGDFRCYRSVESKVGSDACLVVRSRYIRTIKSVWWLLLWI